MYSTIALVKNTKLTGKLVGTHQKIDKIAHSLLLKNVPKNTFFPTKKEVLHFEGIRGPDGLKRKSPGEDEPSHLYVKGDDEDSLIETMLGHRFNLNRALKNGDSTRAAFDAAWLAHYVADGLTPAHHIPLHDIANELMSDKEFFKIFGEPVKGIMRGDTTFETLKNNWKYWGVDGHMSRHLAFEFGIALVAMRSTNKELTPKIKRSELKNVDLEKEFRAAADRIYDLNLYQRFADYGWTPSVAKDIKKKLLPEAIRLTVLAWASALPKEEKCK